MSEQTTQSPSALARVDDRRNAIATPVSAQMPIQELATHLAKSGYFKDTRDVSQCIVKVLYGQELGFPAISSMMGIHIIEGKPVCSATLMASMVKRSGVYDYRVAEMTDERCEIAWFQRGEKIGTSAWTIKDAQRAGLAGKNNWKSYPRQMLFSRTVGEGVRTFFPDLFGGAPVYTADEAQDMAWETTATVGGSEIQVNRETGEMKEARPLATEAQQRLDNHQGTGFIGGRPGEQAQPAPTTPTDLKSLQNAVKACLINIGQSAEQAGAPREYLAAVLMRDVNKLSDLSLSDWQDLHRELQPARIKQKRMFACWNDFRKAEGLTESDRLATFSDILGRPVESASLLTPAEMEVLADVLTAKANGLPTEAQTAILDAEVVEDSSPFAHEPEHPSSALATL